MENEASIQVLDRAFRIIDVLANCGESLSLGEVSTLSGISKSTAFRILKSLKKNGYAAQNTYGQYYLTLKICTISRRVLKKTNIISLAQPHLKRLCFVAHQPVHLTVREGNEVVYVCREEDPTAPFHMNSVVGNRRFMHTCAMGKSILAALPNNEIVSYWHEVEKPQITPYTITTLDTLLKEISQVRRDGYAIDRQENVLGIGCIAMAVKGQIGTPSYAISISMPYEQMTEAKIKDLVPFLLSTGNSIAAVLGYQ